MPARPDPAHLSAWRLLLEAHASVTELLEHELVAERGLPLTRYDVLLNLAEAPGGRLRMQELSASVLLSKSGLSRLVDRMVEAGLVRREQSTDDRRGWFAVLTDQGRSALRRAAPVHLRGIQEHFARHLDPGEAQVLATALAKVVAAAGSVCAEPRPLTQQPDGGPMDKATASRRLEEERSRLQGIRDDLHREQEESASDTAGELSSFDQHPGDSGTETFEKEKNVSVLEQVEDELLEIEAAFQRLERGTYGSCQACGRPVGDERLEAMPATRFCVEDQAKAERAAGYPGSRA